MLLVLKKYHCWTKLKSPSIPLRFHGIRHFFKSRITSDSLTKEHPANVASGSCQVSGQKQSDGSNATPNYQKDTTSQNHQTDPTSNPHNGETFNQVNIQMLFQNLHQQLFGNNSERPRVQSEVLEEIVRHLKDHDLWGKPTSEQPPVPLTLPSLQGDLDAHFRSIAEEVSQPYREKAEWLARDSLPEPPPQWVEKAGWTRYCHTTGTATPVSFPTCSALVFDVEVLMCEGQFPTMATAASPDAWYSWCSPRVFSSDRPHGKVQLNDLIPMESHCNAHRPPGNRWMNRLVVGHNVSFDRSFIKEQYYIDAPRTRFLDTMSLHISVCGLTATQRILFQALRKGKSGFNRKEIRDKFRPDSLQSFQWTEESSMNNLQDVHQLHCPDQPAISKQTRDVFMKGDMGDVQGQYQELMSYCAGDVKATHAVYQNLWSQFKERLPHPVTFTGLLQMGTAYLPIRSSWQRYISASDAVYERYQEELKETLMGLAEEALGMWEGERYQGDIWLWDLDWAPRKLRLPYPNVSVDEEDISREEEVTPDEEKKKKKKVTKPAPANSKTFPVWYSDLLPKLAGRTSDLSLVPSQISTLRRCTPKLLRLTWKGFPLHHHKEHGWGYLRPAEDMSSVCKDEVMEELQQQEDEMGVEEDPEGFPLSVFLSYCSELPGYKAERGRVEEGQMLEQEIIKLEQELEESESEEERISLLREIKQMQRLAGRSKKKRGHQSGAEDGSHDIGIPGVSFFRLPHKNGPKHRVGNPLSKDFLSHIESGILGSALGDHLNTVHKLSKICSYWKNNMKRVHSQIDMELPVEALDETVKSALAGQDDQYVGAIIPRLITAGTVTRRAVENTWLTASNAYEDSIGSELKSMVQSPPGYCFVGADVDSQELWIAALLGDAYFGSIHGCTALGWMTLQGNKANGTDLHSKVAALVGISRDQAKVFNYGRIYGAGQSFAKQLLMQFNHHLSENEAEKRAKALYHSTKGKRTKKFELGSAGRWEGGSESAMFNQLEQVIVEELPRTPVLGCQISKALEPQKVNSDFLTSRINWVVQSSAVDYLHLMLVCMTWLCEKYDIQARFCISIHDEVRYLVKQEDRYRAALALQITNLLTRAMFAYRMGMNDLPQSVAFFSSVDIDTCLRKEVYLDCVTPSNPEGMRKGYNIQPGESLSIYDILEKTGGSLFKKPGKQEEHETALDFIDLG